MKLAASTLGFRHDDLNTALKAIKANGFDTVDVLAISSYCPHYDILGTSAADWDALASTLNGLSLKVAALNVGEGSLGDPTSETRAMAGYHKAIQLAEKLGCYAVTIQSGVDPATSGIDWDVGADRVAPLLRELSEAAADRGLSLAVEIHKKQLVANSNNALAMAERVQHPAYGYTLDPSHLIYAGERPEDSAAVLGDLVKHVHLRDAIGQNIMVVPGDGQANFGELFKVLAERGYNRCCTIELEYEYAKAPQVSDDLARAKAYLTPLARWDA